MEYQGIKNHLDTTLKKLPFLRPFVYFLLNTLLLRNWYIKRILKKSLNQSSRVFDAGAGFCQYTHYILSRFKESKVHAVDINEKQLNNYQRFAQKFQNRLSIQTADLQEYVPQGHYDLILAVDILEHIENDVAVLSNLSKSLSQEGRLIISTPYESKEADFTEEHIRSGYSKEEIERKLNMSGLKIEELKYSYGFWGHISWVLGMKIPLTVYEKSGFLRYLVVPVYYLVFCPLTLILMVFDYHAKNEKGKGMIIIAKKS